MLLHQLQHFQLTNIFYEIKLLKFAVSSNISLILQTYKILNFLNKLIIFQISTTEFQARLYVKEPLDYESRSAYIINLEASDMSEKPLTAYASVAITIADVQDQPPVFLNGPYSANVPENTEPVS